MYVSLGITLLVVILLHLVESLTRDRLTDFWVATSFNSLGLYAIVPFLVDPLFYRSMSFETNFIHNNANFVLQMILIYSNAMVVLASKSSINKYGLPILLGWSCLAIVSFLNGEAVLNAVCVIGLLYTILKTPSQQVLYVRKTVLFSSGIAVLSLIYAIAEPGLAWVTTNQGRGLVPSGQLAGIMPQPNSLAIVAGLGLLMTSFDSGLGIVVSNLARILLLTAISLSASRTGLAFVVIYLGMMLSITLSSRVSAGVKKTLFTVVGAFLILYLVLDTNSQNSFNLNGRDAIWSDSIAIGLENPVFGHGLEWSGVAAHEGTSYLTQHVGQAHNQFLDTFVRGGLVGVLFLLIFLFATFRVVRKSKNTQLMFLWFAVTVSGISEAYIHPQLGSITFAVWAAIYLLCFSPNASANPSRKTSTIVAVEKFSE